MLGRILFTWTAMRKNKKNLKSFWALDSNKINQLSDLSLDFCQKRDIQVLVLDFDGVLAAHGENQPNSNNHVWLEKLVHANPELKICVLSNNPLLSRQEFFKDHFPSFVWISGVAKKPYPDGLLKIISEFNKPAQKICLIDDRLLTGVLASVLAGTQAILVTRPVRALRKHFIKECFFMVLRSLERWWVA